MARKSVDYTEAARRLGVAMDGRFTKKDIDQLVKDGQLVGARVGATEPRAVSTASVERLCRLGLSAAEFRRRFLS